MKLVVYGFFWISSRNRMLSDQNWYLVRP